MDAETLMGVWLVGFMLKSMTVFHVFFVKNGHIDKFKPYAKFTNVGATILILLYIDILLLIAVLIATLMLLQWVFIREEDEENIKSGEPLSIWDKY